MTHDTAAALVHPIEHIWPFSSGRSNAETHRRSLWVVVDCSVVFLSGYFSCITCNCIVGRVPIRSAAFHEVINGDNDEYVRNCMFLVARSVDATITVHFHELCAVLLLFQFAATCRCQSSVARCTCYMFAPHHVSQFTATNAFDMETASGCTSARRAISCGGWCAFGTLPIVLDMVVAVTRYRWTNSFCCAHWMQ